MFLTSLKILLVRFCIAAFYSSSRIFTFWALTSSPTTNLSCETATPGAGFYVHCKEFGLLACILCIILEDAKQHIFILISFKIIMLWHAPEQAVAKVVLPQLFNWNLCSVGESLSLPLSNSTPSHMTEETDFGLVSPKKSQSLCCWPVFGTVSWLPYS